MTNSQNGWPAYATTEQFTRSSVCGFGFWAANADVAVVFAEFIHRFDVEVEELTQPVLDDWSYANRLVRGSTHTVSNHGSATAIDLNALKHPRGVHDTFTAAKQRAMHQIRDDITDDAGRPVLRLGMDFTTTVDDMHVEINATATQVKQAADKIRARVAREEDDMKLTDEVDLTPKAEELLGGPTATVRELLQWPPGVRAARDEIERARDQSAKSSAAILAQGAVQGTQLSRIADTLAQVAETLTQILDRLPPAEPPAAG